MYVTSISDDSYSDMFFVARIVAREIDELGGTWGAWVYNKEMAVASYNDGESAVDYFEIDISNDINIRDLRDRVSKVVRNRYECCHYFDCCGCWFLSSLSITSAELPVHLQAVLDEGAGSTYIVRLSTGRNV